MKRVLLMALASVAFSLLAGQASAQAPAVSMEQALTIAQKGGSGFTLIYGRFEAGGLWGFYFMTAEGILIEKEVSGITGQIVKDKVVPDIKKKPKNTVDPDPKVINLLQNKTLTKMPFSRLLEIAAENGVSPVNGFNLSNQGNQLVVTISGGSGSIILDLTTGQIVSKN